MDDLITKDENVARIQKIFDCDNFIREIKNRHQFIQEELLALVDLCDQFDIPQPEISQRDGIFNEGYQGIAEWRFDWIISICIGGEHDGITFIAEGDERDFIECNFASISGAFALVKLFVLKVVYD